MFRSDSPPRSWLRSSTSRSGPYGTGGILGTRPPALIRSCTPIDEANLRDALRRFAASVPGGSAQRAGEATGGGDAAGAPAHAGAAGRFQVPGAVISDAAGRARLQAGQASRERCLAILADVGTTFLIFSPVVRRVIFEEGSEFWFLRDTLPDLG